MWTHDGFGIPLGKQNLDSIKSAPSDSILDAHRYPNESTCIEKIPADSLSSRIGMVYVFKTGKDPRDGYPYYAKIRVLDFIVRDAAKHEVDMIFAWAANISGKTDLTTQILDTFNIPVSLAPLRLASASTLRPGRAPLVRVRISVAGHGAGRVRVERVGSGQGFDLRGRGVGPRRGNDGLLE